jgi:dienelactone hydrolase
VSVPDAAAQSTRVAVTVVPKASLVDEPLHIRVAGLHARSSAEIRLRVRDAETLARIPLEYFERALTWLRAQPQVDPSRIVVIGVSRGSEAAQLLGVYYPSLVNGVVASVPSNVALCGFPDCSQPAWTLNGAPLPYTQQFDNPYPTDNPDAVIPDERIHGPLFAVCGGSDLVWFSCPYASAIMDRLSAHGHPYRDVLYAYPRAGHFVGGLLPYSPVAPRALYLNPADERAREAVWPKLLSFLARL